jgi:hypothetical protein
VLLPADGGLVEFDPGTLDPEVGGFTDPVGGAVGLLVGGVVEGVIAPGLWLWLAEPEPAGAPPAGEDPPAGALCAATQLPQKSTERNMSFLEDIAKPPVLIIS